MPGIVSPGSDMTFPDTLYSPATIQSAGRLNPNPPGLAVLANLQDDFGGDSLRSLFRLLTI